MCLLSVRQRPFGVGVGIDVRVNVGSGFLLCFVVRSRFDHSFEAR